MGTHRGPDSRMILKSDTENALKAVREAVGKYHGGIVVPENPPRGESQSNGRVEEAGKTIREHTRAMKEQLGDRAQMTLKSDDIITQWMIRWAAMLCTRYKVVIDGLTAYERS